jgi:hypothetical protein
VDDRLAISEILTELLAHGALLGDSGRDHELYMLSREYQRELTEYLAPLGLELISDPDRPHCQLRPAPGDCGLMARFNKAETLLVLTLWRIYHDKRMESPVPTVIVSANEIWQRLQVYFKTLTAPTEAQLRDMLTKLRQRRLVRIQWHEDPSRFGESQVEILPTLQRVIPFDSAAAWEQHASLYEQAEAVEADAREVES